jgi:hypothetical protein
MNDSKKYEWKPGIQLLSGIDDELVSEALSPAPRKRARLGLLYAAAAVILVSAAALTLAHFIKKPNGGVEAMIPIPHGQSATAEPAAPTNPTETLPPTVPSPTEAPAPDESDHPAMTASPTAEAPSVTAAPTASPTVLDSTDASPAVTPTSVPTPAPTGTTKPADTQKPANTPKPTGTTKPANTPKPTNTPKPNTTQAPIIFRSEEEFQAAVLSGEHTNDSMSWVTHYYKPARAPEGTELSHIWVNGAGIGIYYRIPGEFNEHGEPVCIVFAWYPRQDEEDMLRAVNSHTVPYETMGPYYIFFQPDYTSVYWMQDGNSFFMTSPPGNLTRENIPAYCDAVLVPIR